MISAFVDSSVLFTACISSRGASRAILEYSLRNQVALVISAVVLRETERNLTDKTPTALPEFQRLVNVVPFELVRPSLQEVLEAQTYTALKDAPIVAAAKQAGVDYLVSLDRRHLVGVPEVSERSGLSIVLPETLLARIRESFGEEE